MAYCSVYDMLEINVKLTELISDQDKIRVEINKIRELD